MDQLTNIIRINDSPQVARELHALVGQDTYNRVISTYLTDAYERAFVGIGENSQRFDPGAFAQALGITKSTSSRRGAVKQMLELSDTGMSIDTLDELVNVGVMLQDVDVPKMSVFLARSATIGGLKNLINRLIPIGIAQQGVKGGWLGANLSMAMVGIIGSRIAMKALADPINVVLVRKVFDREAPYLVRRGVAIKLMKTAINGMTKAEASKEAGIQKSRMNITGEMSDEQFEGWKEKSIKLYEMFWDKLKEQADFSGEGEIE